jgi:hypothetical protein
MAQKRTTSRWSLLRRLHPDKTIATQTSAITARVHPRHRRMKDAIAITRA